MPRPSVSDITSAAAPGLSTAWVVVASRFHATIVDRLVEGASACLVGKGVPPSSIRVLRVAGAFELPQAAAGIARASCQERPLGIVALGAVVRGETPHFDYVCAEACRGLMHVALTTGVPIGFGLLTCDDLAQALARAGGEAGNKGWEAAEAAWDLAAVLAGASSPSITAPTTRRGA